ncbi:MAG TPA: ABC transporter ATP-binding protein [Polyangiaceae bacterium]|nr:ABC transporter ATP-binding protein [Polyangiaceae bacterium]
MSYLVRLFGFIKPYRALAVVSLVLLTLLVGFDLAIPRLIQRIIDHGIREHDRGVVLSTALVMLGISAVSTVIAVGNNVYSVRVGEGVARDLREALFLKIQSYSFGNLDRQKTGQLMVRLTSDVNAIKSLVQISLRIGTRAPLLMLGSLALMITTSRDLALTMLPLLGLTSALIVFFIVKMEPLFRTVQAKLDVLNDVLQENIAGARLVKAFVRARYENERFAAANLDMTERSIQVMKFTSTMVPVLTLCVNVGMVIVVWSGGLSAIRGHLSLGQIVAFSNYMLTTMTPLVMMTMLSNTWAAGLASARRVNDVLETVPDVRDAPDAVPVPASAAARVALERVSFAYAGEGNEAVLSDITFHAEPGQTIAILGATGAGKSTLVDLIPRFYDATSGVVSFDGKDVKKLTQDSLVAQMGVVLQEAILFTGTVRDNIRYGKPDASDDDVVRAAKMAEAHDFVTKLPRGYDTHVEERGANFSGGQKQRLSIARALLLRPKLLLLDDSTSAVDVETETRIQDALDQDKAQRTTIVVAQRISTVLKADRIFVLDRGRIVASGTHHELMASSVVYQEIYESQLGKGVASDSLPPSGEARP